MNFDSGAPVISLGYANRHVGPLAFTKENVDDDLYDRLGTGTKPSSLGGNIKGRLLVLSSCTGTQGRIQKTKQYITANLRHLNKENTVVISLFSGIRGHSPIV